MYSEFVEQFQKGYDWGKEKKRDKKLAKLLDFDLEQAEKIRALESPWEMLERETQNAMSDLAVASDPSLQGGQQVIGSTDFGNTDWSSSTGKPAIPDRILTSSKPDLSGAVIDTRQANRAALEATPSPLPGATMANPELKETYWDRLKKANAYADGGKVFPKLTEEEKRRMEREAPINRGWYDEARRRQEGLPAYRGTPELGRQAPQALQPQEGVLRAPWREGVQTVSGTPMPPEQATRPGDIVDRSKLPRLTHYNDVKPAPQPGADLSFADYQRTRPDQTDPVRREAWGLDPVGSSGPAKPAVPTSDASSTPGPSNRGGRRGPRGGSGSPAALPTGEMEEVPMFTPAKDFPGDVRRMPKISTQVWSKYRQQVWEAAKAGGRMADVQAVDKYVTSMQHEGFMNYAQEARALLAAGDMEGAQKAIHMAYQYFPNGTQAEFAVHKGQLVAVALDEETGKPVGMQAITPKWLDGVIMNFKDPNNFAQHTIDTRAQDLKEKDFNERLLPLGQAQSTALYAGAQADITNSVANRERAINAGGVDAATVSQQQAAAKALDASNQEYLAMLPPEAVEQGVGDKLVVLQLEILKMNPQLMGSPQLAAATGRAIMDRALGIEKGQPRFRLFRSGSKYAVQLEGSSTPVEIPAAVFEQLTKGQ